MHLQLAELAELAKQTKQTKNKQVSHFYVVALA